MPTKPTDIADFVRQRHPEWVEHQLRWRFLLDSYEGGDRYRFAVYGNDPRGYPKRNLSRYKREYEPQDAGVGQWGSSSQTATDSAGLATDDDYSMRLERTPVPTIVADGVEVHLSRIFAEEIARKSPSQALTDWWADVDGLGTSMDQWMAESVAPLLMVLGCLDVVCDHPPAPDGIEIETRADEMAYRLDRCVAGVILPENMVNWRLDPSGRHYTECVVCEIQDDRSVLYRYWNQSEWILYDDKGAVRKQGTHPFGRPPIVRLFDRRRPHCRNIGLPRYEGVAELNREYYNLHSELILSDTTQAHPVLQGPEDFFQLDGVMPVGPGWVLPKKKNTQGASATYEGWEVVDFPKGGAESIRQNMALLRDRADRAMCLTKPAGTSGTDANSVSQSGVSKQLDHSTGNDLLAKIAGVLEHAEIEILELVSLVQGNGTPDQAALEATTINYPRSFDLMAPGERALAIGEYQTILDRAGQCPEAELPMIGLLFRGIVPGLDDKVYKDVDKAHKKLLDAKSDQLEAGLAMAEQGLDANGQPVAAPQADGSFPATDGELVGQSATAANGQTAAA